MCTSAVLLQMAATASLAVAAVHLSSIFPLYRRQMVDVAQAEERVILTCDRTFIRMGYSDQAFYVRTTNKQEQVREVLAHFGITVTEDSLLSRCAKCNGTFYPRCSCSAAAVTLHTKWSYTSQQLFECHNRKVDTSGQRDIMLSHCMLVQRWLPNRA